MKNLFHNTIAGIIWGCLAAGALALVIAILAFMRTTDPSHLAGNFNVTGGGTYRLYSSVGTSDSTITLSSFKEPVSNTPYTMSYINTDIGYGTIDPNSSSISEFVSFTGITQNSDGTATLTGVTRGLARTPGSGGCVASTTLAEPHSGQAIFILSNSPCFQSEYLPARTTATSSAILVFSSTTPPRYDKVAAQASGTYIATTSELASVAYVNAVANAGASNATQSVKGIVQLATAAQAASSTALAGGSTGASLVLPTSIATDTPQNCSSAGCVVMSLIGGKLNQAWLDLTKSFAFTGYDTFSTLFATNASSTNATTSSLYITRLASSLLKVDASGQVVAATAGTDYVSGSLSYATTTSITVTSNTATSTFFTIPAGTIGASSTIDVHVQGGISTNGSGSGSCTVTLAANNATLGSATIGSEPISQIDQGWADFHVMSKYSNQAQYTATQSFCITKGATPTGCASASMSSTAFNFSSSVELELVLTGSTNLNYCKMFSYMITVRP